MLDLNERPKLYTVLVDDYGTGIGRTLIAMVCWGYNDSEVLDKFAQEIGVSSEAARYYSEGAEVKNGVNLEDPVLKQLIGPAAINLLSHIETNPCHIVWFQKLHYNFA